MRTYLSMFVILAAALSNVHELKADHLQLTVDLRNANRVMPLNGGTWQLFARIIDTGRGPEGSGGLAGIRALLDNVNLDGITLNPAINPNAVATVQTIPGDAEGTVEIVYRQDLTQPTLSGVGVPPAGFPNRDVLIGSGSWPPGPRPAFGSEGITTSSGEFLSDDGTAAVSPDSVFASVFTLGDLNNSAIINGLDTGAFIARLPGGVLAGQFHGAADMYQDGVINNLDVGRYIQILSGPAFTAVPEPSAIALLILACVMAVRRQSL